MKQEMSTSSGVRVTNVSFNELFAQNTRPFDQRFPLALDTYQRGFVWNDDKIRQLVTDLHEYQNPGGREGSNPPELDYYMGTILIHTHTDQNANQSRHFIIDGQQRLTALCVLYFQLHPGKLPPNCSLSYSERSAITIRKASRIYQEPGHTLRADIFERIQFTVIEVDRVDLAFIFFDTQNNRGVKLHATDLLKAYHLRAVDGDPDTRMEVQKHCGQRWEHIQHGKSVLSHDLGFTAALFTKFLWRSRKWTGQQVTPGDHDALLDEFQRATWKSEAAANTVPLYRSRNNRFLTDLTVEGATMTVTHTHRMPLGNHAADLPFAIRQPIHKGVGFFLYADKYSALLQWLMHEPTESTERLAFHRLHDQVMTKTSLYLREVFLLCSLMFADQFGEEKLLQFSLWLEHTLGSIRLQKEQVRYETAQNIFKKDHLNFLDVIANSFLPEQVIHHLQNHRQKEIESWYEKETVPVGKGVQGIYKKAVLDYYRQDQSKSLEEKRSWLMARIQEAQS